jgi:hypothetical protein
MVNAFYVLFAEILKVFTAFSHFVFKAFTHSVVGQNNVDVVFFAFPNRVSLERRARYAHAKSITSFERFRIYASSINNMLSVEPLYAFYFEVTVGVVAE